MWSKIEKTNSQNKICKTEMKGPNVDFLVFLTIIISVFDGQIFGYKQLSLISELVTQPRLADIVKFTKATYLYLTLSDGM